jgi:hypothetical protein
MPPLRLPNKPGKTGKNYPVALTFVILRSQPQMQKYRSPWGRSSTNHNM